MAPPLMSFKALIAAVFIGLATTLSAQNVHVVDVSNGPGADFTTISEAVAAAASGDLVLVRAGDYQFESVVVRDRGIIIQGEAGATVDIATIVVDNLPVGEFFAARNLTLRGGSISINAGNCAGRLWFEDLQVKGEQRAFSAGGAFLRDCDQVVFVRCNFEAPFNLGIDHTMCIDQSVVHLFDCSVDGADGIGNVFFGFPGDNAIALFDGELFLNGSTLRGGAGANAVGLNTDGLAGGNGLALESTGGTVHVLDSMLLPGTGGAPNGVGVQGLDGVSILQNAQGATVINDMGVMRRYRASSPVRENSLLQVNVEGLAGDTVLVSTPPTPGATRTSRIWNGAAVVNLFPFQSLGTLPASGLIAPTFTTPFLPATSEFATVFSQAYLRDSRFTVASPSMVILLDESF